MGFFNLYFLYNVIFLLDMWDIVIRLYSRMRYVGSKRNVEGKTLAPPTSIPLGLPHMTDEEKKRRLKPFAVIVSVFNAEEYIREFLEWMKPYHDRLWVIDDCSTDGTNRVLEEYNIRYLRNDTNLKKPASIKGAVEALPGDVETVMVMDPDSRIVESGMKSMMTDMEEVISDFQRGGADGCAVRLRVKNAESFLVKLQELEYRMCISLGRKSLLDRTVLSGIAIYKRSSLETALRRHSLSVYAEDFMTSLLILNNGGRIYYDGRLLVETEGKSDLKGLISQRIGWDFGYIMTYFHTLHRAFVKKDIHPLLLRDRRPLIWYNYALYLGVLGILLHPVKVSSIILLSLSFANLSAMLSGLSLPFNEPAFNPLWVMTFYLQYSILSLLVVGWVVEKERRSRYWAIAPLYPLYAIFLLIVRTIGFLNYLTFLTFRKKLYHDHY